MESPEKVQKLENEVRELEYQLRQKRLELAYVKGENLEVGGIDMAFWKKPSALIGLGLIVVGVIVALTLNVKIDGGSVGSDTPSRQKAAIGDSVIGSAEVSVDDDPSMGPKDAKVTIIEFSDFQCPFCRRFWIDSVKQIENEYIKTGKSVRLVYRDFPLPFHSMALPYALATQCANEQGKFWQLHDRIFQEQETKDNGAVADFTIDDVKAWARELGLNVVQFNTCVDSQKYKKEIEKDIADGTAAGVKGTPATFINGRLIVGAQPYATIKAIIEEELKK